jgi:excisionase family DNA binding protein
MSAKSSSQDQVVSITEAAKILNISRFTLRRRARAGAIAVLQLSPRRIGIRLSELSRFMAAAEQREGGQAIP